jgi:hypothetical protein
MRDRRPPHEQLVKNSFWIRRASTGQWVRVESGQADSADDEPRPRYAHQVSLLFSRVSGDVPD